VIIYGMEQWADLFTPRQLLAIITFVQLIYKAGELQAREAQLNDFSKAIQTILGLALSRYTDIYNSLCMWETTRTQVRHAFTRQAIPMLWDFAEAHIFADAAGNYAVTLETMVRFIEKNVATEAIGNSQQADATAHLLPDDAAQCFFTDPPYYDSVPYADLADFFYVWQKRTLAEVHPDLYRQILTPKKEQAIVWHPNSMDERLEFETKMTRALSEGRRVLRSDGIGMIVFAHKSTSGWEAQLQAMVEAGWMITTSWPIDTELGNRMNAQGTASLASSIHLICRPRENPDGSLNSTTISDWRDVLRELPERIHAWLPRLAREGVVGADAIFACLGPALEIFSRYSRVEKASGEQVMLKEYLEHVWAAVAKEALETIFEGADATGFEADARLTAIWFWTLKAATNGNGQSNAFSDDEEGDETLEDRPPSTSKKTPGYTMEYDAARKLAQGLGADLTKLSRPGGIITIRGNIATLNGISHRHSYLIGQQQTLFGDIETIRPSRRIGQGRTPSTTMKPVESRQMSLFDEEMIIPANPDQPFLPTLKPTQHLRPLMDRLLDSGVTILDRLHQAMLLFGRSLTALLGPFLDETHMGNNPRFWRLANALAALYPPGTEEKRWVDGVLARKKGLGY
jgi:hypothetical protein